MVWAILASFAVVVYGGLVFRFIRHNALAFSELNKMEEPYIRDCEVYKSLKSLTLKQKRFTNLLLNSPDRATQIIKSCVNNYYGYSDKTLFLFGMPLPLILRYTILGTAGHKKKKRQETCDLQNVLTNNKISIEHQKKYLTFIEDILIIHSFNINFMYGVFFRRVIIKCYCPENYKIHNALNSNNSTEPFLGDLLCLLDEPLTNDITSDLQKASN